MTAPPKLIPMTYADVAALAKPVAKSLSLSLDVVMAIVEVESSFCPEAKRYEPRFDQKFDITAHNPFIHPSYTRQDEEHGRATSWGLMQIMGENARFMGFRGRFEELLEAKTALTWSVQFLYRLFKRHFAAHGWPGVVAAYNWGSPAFEPDGKFMNQAYVDKVLHALGGDWPQ